MNAQGKTWWLGAATRFLHILLAEDGGGGAPHHRWGHAKGMLQDANRQGIRAVGNSAFKAERDVRDVRAVVDAVLTRALCD